MSKNICKSCKEPTDFYVPVKISGSCEDYYFNDGTMDLQHTSILHDSLGYKASKKAYCVECGGYYGKVKDLKVKEI